MTRTLSPTDHESKLLDWRSGFFEPALPNSENQRLPQPGVAELETLLEEAAGNNPLAGQQKSIGHLSQPQAKRQRRSGKKRKPRQHRAGSLCKLGIRHRFRRRRIVHASAFFVI